MKKVELKNTHRNSYRIKFYHRCSFQYQIRTVVQLTKTRIEVIFSQHVVQFASHIKDRYNLIISIAIHQINTLVFCHCHSVTFHRCQSTPQTREPETSLKNIFTFYFRLRYQAKPCILK